MLTFNSRRQLLPQRSKRHLAWRQLSRTEARLMASQVSSPLKSDFLVTFWPDNSDNIFFECDPKKTFTKNQPMCTEKKTINSSAQPDS